MEEKKNNNTKIIAVDFDGTLCTDHYPQIGTANDTLICRLIECREAGDRIILWTCRVGLRLQEALLFCRTRGLEFDAVNENLPETISRFGGDSRKIYADIYIDDRSFRPWELCSWQNLA